MLLTLLAASALDSSRLRSGMTWAGEATVHFLNRAAELDETDRLRLTFRVTGQDHRVWLVQRIGETLSTQISGADIPPPPKQDPQITGQFLAPGGFLLDEEPFDPGQFYLDRLLAFWLPPDNPDHWSADMTTESEHSVAKGHAEFKLTRKAETSWKYSFAYKSVDYSLGVSATGEMWFDTTSGRLLRAKIEAKQALIPGGTERVDASVAYVDAPVKK
jgi:hypothetical protein